MFLVSYFCLSKILMLKFIIIFSVAFGSVIHERDSDLSIQMKYNFCTLKHVMFEYPSQIIMVPSMIRRMCFVSSGVSSNQRIN